MKNAPLDLEWASILPEHEEAAPPLELEVVPSGEPSPDETLMVASFSDHQIQEKIGRLQHLVSGREISPELTDRGAKIQTQILLLDAELLRRRNRRVKEGAKECDNATPVKAMEPIDLVGDINGGSISPKSHSKSSFASLFSKGLEDAPFIEELRYVSGDKPRAGPKGIRGKCSAMHGDKPRDGPKGSDGKRSEMLSSQHAKMSSRDKPFHFFLDEKEGGSLNRGCRLIESYADTTLHGKQNFESQTSKRRRASGNLHLLKSKKVEEVVVLDEDAQPANLVKQTACCEWKETKIYYPSRDDPESVELSYSDIKCLDPGSFLTSNIMNFYIHYLQRSLYSIRRSRGENYIFNTYFYEKLKEAASCMDDKGASFQRLRRWWKGVDIFKKSYIFLPIHGNLHWSLVIICIPAKEEESGPIILHLDSLGLHSSKMIFDIINSYLTDEWSFINQSDTPFDIPFPENIWKHLPCQIKKQKIMVPQQKNEYDCGLFVLYYMERFITEAPERIQRKDLDMFGKKWFKPEEASRLRKRIRELLLEEFESARLDIGEETSPESADSSAKFESVMLDIGDEESPESADSPEQIVELSEPSQQKSIILY